MTKDYIALYNHFCEDNHVWAYKWLTEAVARSKFSAFLIKHIASLLDTTVPRILSIPIWLNPVAAETLDFTFAAPLGPLPNDVLEAAARGLEQSAAALPWLQDEDDDPTLKGQCDFYGGCMAICNVMTVGYLHLSPFQLAAYSMARSWFEFCMADGLLHYAVSAYYYDALPDRWATLAWYWPCPFDEGISYAYGAKTWTWCLEPRAQGLVLASLGLRDDIALLRQWRDFQTAWYLWIMAERYPQGIGAGDDAPYKSGPTGRWGDSCPLVPLDKTRVMTVEGLSRYDMEDSQRLAQGFLTDWIKRGMKHAE
jgi:hypothetical protein